MTARSKASSRRRRDGLRTFARLLSALFAIVGALPLLLAVVARTTWARAYAAKTAEALLHREFDVTATFRAELRVLPPSIVVRDLVVPASDGGEPFLRVERASIAPRLFALLSGRFDAGEIDVESPRLRAVVANGAIANLRYRLPPSSPDTTPSTKPPFRSLAVTRGFVDVTLQSAGVATQLDDIDVDVSATDGPTFDVAVRLAGGSVRRHRDGAVDDDAICRFGARVHVEDGTVLLRRLEIAARLDDDPKENSPRACTGEVSREDAIQIEASRLRIGKGAGDLPTLAGHLTLTAPLRVAARVAQDAPPLSGALGLDADVSYTGLPELPTARGRLALHDAVLRTPTRAGWVERHLAESLDARFETSPEEARLEDAKIAWADGEVDIKNAKVSPLLPGLPLDVDEVEFKKLHFPTLLRDVGITQHTIVAWTLDAGTIKGFRGVLFDPQKHGPNLIGDVTATTSAFEVTDRGWDDPARKHVVAVHHAVVKAKWGFEPIGMVFKNAVVDFGRSHLESPSILVGFRELLEIKVGKGTRLDLADITPLATVPLAGKLEVEALIHGGQSNPKIDGDVHGTGFRLGDSPLADTFTAHAEFQPYTLDFTKLHATKGHTAFDASLVRLDLNRSEGIQVDALVASKRIDVRDVLAMFRYEYDPRFSDIHGFGDGKVSVRYETGTPNDVCKSGVLSVRILSELSEVELFGERYDGGSLDMDYVWFDRASQERGVDATIRSAMLKKGRGTISGGGSIRRGAELRGHFIAHDVPLARIDALGDLGRAVDGSVNATGDITGTVDAIAADVSVTLGAVRIGQKLLPPSAFAVKLVPTPRAESARKKSTDAPRCGEDVPPPFNLKDFERDESRGVFHTSGTLFGGQITLDDVQTTRQRSKRVRGKIGLKKLDLGAIAQLVPSFVLSEAPPTGQISGTVDVASLELDHPDRAEVEIALDDLSVAQRGYRAKLRSRKEGGPVEVALSADTATFAPMDLEVSNAQDVTAEIELSGKIRHVTTSRDLEVDVKLAPIDIASVAGLLPRVESASGRLEAWVSLTGHASAPVARGELKLVHGELQVRGMPVSLEDVNVAARIDEHEIRLVSASAKAGGGTVLVTGRAALHGFEIGEVTCRLDATDMRLPVVDGVELTANAQLAATLPVETKDGPRKKAEVTGTVTLTSFQYTRRIGVSADFDTLARRGKRTEVKVYDPDDDFVDFSIAIRSTQPLSFRNNLIEADVALDTDALVLSGTNQRFGLRGGLRVVKGGRLLFRSNEFDIRQGTIRFDDPTRIAPHVDLLATTDYRRYASSASASASGGGTAGGATGTTAAGGSWRITLRAHGDADDLKIDLSSEPQLAQEDIVLLLTVGMTHAELDQLQAANVGSTAALEALSALSGADSVVKTAIPILDDFRFGSAYSTRTGRTEPTVSVGKRISDRVRANVTTGLAENRDVRSTVEWKLTPQTSVLGNYDNLNDVTSEGLGNLGADFRVRLEF